MAAKKWVARIQWWRGKNARPRKNQTVSSRLVKAKSIEELAKKIARARKRSWELMETCGRQDPGGYFTKLLEKKIQELSRTEKDIQIDFILNCLSISSENENYPRLSRALSKLSADELRLLQAQFQMVDHDGKSAASSLS